MVSGVRSTQLMVALNWTDPESCEKEMQLKQGEFYI